MTSARTKLRTMPHFLFDDAVTRPALWAGIPNEAAVLLLIASAIALIEFNTPVYAAIVAAFGYALPRLIVRQVPALCAPYQRRIVLLDSGDIMLTFEFEGRAFETSDVPDLNDWHIKLNGLLRNLHGERLSIWTHLIRMRVEHYPSGIFKSDLAARLDRAYFARINSERMFINHFYVMLVVRGGATGGDKIIQMFKRKTSASAKRGPLIDDALVQLLDDKAHDFEKLLARCEPRRCKI